MKSISSLEYQSPTFKFKKHQLSKMQMFKLNMLLFSMGVIQHTFFFIINVALDDLDQVFRSKSLVIVSLGYVPSLNLLAYI